MFQEKKYLYMINDYKKGVVVEGDKTIEAGKIFEGLTKEQILLKLHEELTECLLKSIDFENETKTIFPIEFENEFGNYKTFSDGTTLFRPKYAIEYIDIKINITLDGLKFENNDK